MFRQLSFLRSAAEKLHNQDFSASVAKVDEVPLNGAGFVKVQTLIEELSLRLQKVSREEQSDVFGATRHLKQPCELRESLAAVGVLEQIASIVTQL